MPHLFDDPCRPPLKVRYQNYRESITAAFKPKTDHFDREQLIGYAEDWAGASLTQTLPESFDVLLDAIQQEKGLTGFGINLFKGSVVRALYNRIKIANYVSKHPEVLEEKIEKPIFVVSFPRTGTTLLHNLLSLQPNARVPYTWEVRNLADSAVNSEQDVAHKVASLNENIDGFYNTFPRLRHMHFMRAELPDECLSFFENNFSCISYALAADIQPYVDWLLNTDMTEAYRFHKLQLQILQHGNGGSPWVLKSPLHMYHLKDLLSVYPDASIVQTHREVESVLASRCALYATFRRVTSNRMRYADIGSRQLQQMQTQLDRWQSVRSDPTFSDRFFDVKFSDLVKQPKAVCQSVLRNFDYDCSETYATSVDSWLAKDRHSSKDRNQIGIDAFGLSSEDVRSAFLHYQRQYV